jgi:hypothetical protein
METQGFFYATLDDRSDLCWRGRDTKDQFDLSTIGVLVTGQVAREHFAVEVEARERVRVSPAQTIGQAKVDELLNLRIGGRGVGRPAKGCDNLASLDADEIVPEFDAIAVIILRDDERAKGSVEVELGFVFVHVYKVAQITKKARDFFTIVQIIFVDDFSNERFILQVGTLLEQHIL